MNELTLIQNSNAMLANIAGMYEQASVRNLTNSTIFMDISLPFGEKTSDSRTDAMAIFLLNALSTVALKDTYICPAPEKFAVAGRYSIAKSTDGKPEGLLELQMSPGDKAAFKTWATDMALELKASTEAMRNGWHKEKEGRKEWFVHPPAYEDLSYNPLLPLVVFAQSNDAFLIGGKQPKLQYAGSAKRAGKIRVSEDMMETFLAPAGLQLQDLQLTEQKKRLWRF